MTEQILIRNYFMRTKGSRPDVILGIGDDCALLKPMIDHELAVSTDTLVAGIHFLENTAPEDIGYRALAVNLSDLAAMGATPAWVSLALCLPKENNNDSWMRSFTQGFFELLDTTNAELIGGNLSGGPLVITAQVFGWIPTGQALRRSGAQPGDTIYVTGTLGDAGLALKNLKENYSLNVPDREFIWQRFYRPEARLAVGTTLRGIANAAIDVSDGLAADLGHILEASHVGATLFADDLPLSTALKNNTTREEQIRLALTAGDDYELCFTVAPEQEQKLKQVFNTIDCRYSAVGKIEKLPGCRCIHKNGAVFSLQSTGFDHFVQ